MRQSSTKTIAISATTTPATTRPRLVFTRAPNKVVSLSKWRYCPEIISSSVMELAYQRISLNQINCTSPQKHHSTASTHSLPQGKSTPTFLGELGTAGREDCTNHFLPRQSPQIAPKIPQLHTEKGSHSSVIFYQVLMLSFVARTLSHSFRLEGQARLPSHGKRWAAKIGCMSSFGVHNLEQGRLPISVHLITDPDDPRVLLYRKKTQRPRADCAYEQQSHDLVQRALRAAMLTNVNGTAGAEACLVSVHFSAECLRRLRDAQVSSFQTSSASSKVLEHSRVAPMVHSVFAPSHASEDIWNLAAEITQRVYCADIALFEAAFQRKDSSSKDKMCSFVVAFPVSIPLVDLTPPVLVLCELKNATNIGQILRTAYHLGVTSVVVSRDSWENLGGRAARVSMGWLYHMDFHLAEPSLIDALLALRVRGFKIYAAENHFKTSVAPHAPFGDRRWALVVGNEDVGLNDAVSTTADMHICVPKRRGESLNVAHAAGICLYELGRHMEP